MFGQGSMDDARALQESFGRSKPSRRNNRGRGRGGGGGGGRSSGNGPQRDNFHGNERHALSLPARGPTPRRGPSNTSIPIQRAPPLPATPPFQSIPNREKRIASSEQVHDSKRAKGSSAEGPNQANYLSRSQVSTQPFNSGISAPRTQKDSDDLMDFEEPASPLGPPTRQQNIPSQPIPRDTIPPDSSILNTREEEINQPVMHFTARTGAEECWQEDVSMGGMRKPGVKGLEASRWNLEDAQSSSHYGGEQRSVDTSMPERRGPAPSSGRLVSSGISKGPGLADSRWAS
ncbi:hypothetical protein M434DRAFT_29846 [Hypoxylon sp. CO27-5]|nr:hypothetical protein M434DRAFT_29846 [Hypoxylon sp. CO27-5]